MELCLFRTTYVKTNLIRMSTHWINSRSKFLIQGLNQSIAQLNSEIVQLHSAHFNTATNQYGFSFRFSPIEREYCLITYQLDNSFEFNCICLSINFKWTLVESFAPIVTFNIYKWPMWPLSIPADNEYSWPLFKHEKILNDWNHVTISCYINYWILYFFIYNVTKTDKLP